MKSVHSHIQGRIEQWIGGQMVRLIFAATTGLGVQPYLEFAERHNLRIIAVTAHRLANPRWKPFDPAVRRKIEALGGAVVEERMIWAILRVGPMLIARYIAPLFGYRQRNWEELLAVGGRVCLQVTEIAIKERLIGEGEKVVAIAGENTALGLRITSAWPPRMALLEIIHRPDIELSKP